MRISLRVSVCLMTVGLSLSVTEINGGPTKKCGNKPVNQTAYIESSVTINCTYPKKEENSIKLFCKEDENFNCQDLISTHTANVTIRDRFFLKDYKHQGVFTVSISSLTREDSGRYKCALKRSYNSSLQCYTELHLSVLTWDELTPKAVHVTEESAHIQCQYSQSHEGKDKFLCKGKNPVNCEELIHTTEKDSVDNDRFSIRDNKRKKYFYVYIKNVSTADSGTYWCGSDRTRQHAEYTKIHLSVTERRIKTTKLGLPTLQKATAQPPTTHDDAPDLGAHMNLNAVVIVGVMCLVFLVMALVVLILYRNKPPWRQGGASEQSTNAGNKPEGNYEDHNYEEIQMWNQQASSGHALPSIYAMVTPHTDTLHYTCITFQKDSVSVSTDGNTLPNMNKTGSSACDYSSGAQDGIHPPAAEQPLYSTVTNPRKP